MPMLESECFLHEKYTSASSMLSFLFCFKFQFSGSFAHMIFGAFLHAQFTLLRLVKAREHGRASDDVVKVGVTE